MAFAIGSGPDTGGTFTDLVAGDGRVAKVLSTPDDPGRALREGLAGARRAAAPAGVAGPRHHGGHQRPAGAAGRPGGAGDDRRLRRRDRDRPPGPPVALRHLGRPAGAAGAAGAAPRGRRPTRRRRGRDRARRPAASDVPCPTAWRRWPSACCTPTSTPAHEEAVAAVLAERGFDVSRSSAVSPEFREYERTVTTVVNAYLRPACRPYLEQLEGLADEVLVMTSAGGLVGSVDAARLPAALLLSGPAGGVRAGAAVAAACGFPDAVTFDMGGTSTDVCLVRGGVPEPAPGREVAGFPVRLPALDIHTIGAGGGLDRPPRPRRRPGGRPGERRRRPRPGLLRPGRNGADRDRRRPGARPDPRRRRLSRPRGPTPTPPPRPCSTPWRLVRRGGWCRRGGGAAAGGAARRVVSARGWCRCGGGVVSPWGSAGGGRRRSRLAAGRWRWSTRPWSRRCGPSPSSAASTRPAWPSVAFGGAGPCTPAPWPRRSTWRR